MDIKIRTQAKGKLVDCTRKTIQLGGNIKQLNQVIATDSSGTTIVLGSYKDMDRATEIIDIIQEEIDKAFLSDHIGVMFLMPKD